MTANTAHVDTFIRDNLPPQQTQPEFLLGNLSERFPEQLNAAQFILSRAQSNDWQNNIALRDLQNSITYEELRDRSLAIGQALRHGYGLVPGERVLLQGKNSISQAITWLGVLLAGGVAVMVMPLLRARDITPLANKAKISLAVCDVEKLDELEYVKEDVSTLRDITSFVELVKATSSTAEGEKTNISNFVPVETVGEDPAIIAFTSGTTGQSKGCVHNHRDIIAMCEGFARHVLKPSPEEIFIGSPPLAFTFGLGALLTFPLYYGASSVLLENAAPPALATAIASTKATTLFTAPTGYRAILANLQDYNLTSLQKCISAGENLPSPVFDEWLARTGIKLIDGIGATELLHIFISSAGDDIRHGAVGKVVPGYEARIFDEQMNELPIGEIGRLGIRGPTGCRYLADERQKTYVKNGWNLTGDMFRQDQDGYFYFVARSDDMIVSSGYNISGPEVEQVLLEHDAVAECAVVAAPDDRRGNIVKAFVVLASGHEASEDLIQRLQDFVKSETAPYKYPRSIEFIESLPKTQTGKIQRFRLREMTRGENAK